VVTKAALTVLWFKDWKWKWKSKYVMWLVITLV